MFWCYSNNCPASQRKSLTGLDNIAGSDDFDQIINVMQFIASGCVDLKNATDTIVSQLTVGKQLVNKANCGDVSGSEVADNCRNFALSDPNEVLFQQPCNHQHDKRLLNVKV